MGKVGTGDEAAGGIVVNKPVQITSERGASSTLIRMGGPVVTITVSDVTFGKLNSGFTIATGGNSLPATWPPPPATAAQ